MLISNTLYTKLQHYGRQMDLAPRVLLEKVLYEVPDNCFADLRELLAPVHEFPLDPELEEVVATMAADLGYTPLGLSLVLASIIDRAVEIANANNNAETNLSAPEEQ